MVPRHCVKKYIYVKTKQYTYSDLYLHTKFELTFTYLADDFIQNDLLSGYKFFVSMCVPWESNPQPLRC